MKVFRSKVSVDSFLMALVTSCRLPSANSTPNGMAKAQGMYPSTSLSLVESLKAVASFSFWGQMNGFDESYSLCVL